MPTFNDPKPNHMWYLKGEDGADGAEAAAQDTELARLKQLEQDMMLEALGLKKKSAARAPKPLSGLELKEALKRGDGRDDEEDLIAGVGFGALDTPGWFRAPSVVS